MMIRKYIPLVLLCVSLPCAVFAGEAEALKKPSQGNVQIGSIKSSGSSSSGVRQSINISGADVRVSNGSVKIGDLDEKTAKSNPQQNIVAKDVKVHVNGKNVKINSAEDVKKLNEGRLDELQEER